jgi:hypothetical protein
MTGTKQLIAIIVPEKQNQYETRIKLLIIKINNKQKKIRTPG